MSNYIHLEAKALPQVYEFMRDLGHGDFSRGVELAYERIHERVRRYYNPSRNAAKLAGETFYQPASPCVNGHTCKRYTTSNACFECEVARHKKTYATDAPRRLAIAKERRKDPEHIAMLKAKRDTPEAKAKWRAYTSTDAYKAGRAAWAEANRDRIKGYDKRHRVKKRSARV